MESGLLGSALRCRESEQGAVDAVILFISDEQVVAGRVTSGSSDPLSVVSCDRSVDSKDCWTCSRRRGLWELRKNRLCQGLEHLDSNYRTDGISGFG